MVKLEITNVMDYYYVVNSERYTNRRLYIKFYGIKKLNIGDLIYIDESVIDENIPLYFGEIKGKYGKDDITEKELAILKRNNEKLYFQRYYG